jgi:hypothetical protein
MLTRLQPLIRAHRALQHPVFRTLAATKHPPEKLAAFLREMGAFCQATRNGGNVAEMLHAADRSRAATLFGTIILSEAGHGKHFADMAVKLLAGTPYATEDWLRFPHPSAITAAACAVFGQRDVMDVRGAYTALGATLVLETVAHEQIIPGEVSAFIDSGYYGLTLADVPYLAEHEHAEHIEEAILSLPDDGKILTSVTIGCVRALGVLVAFYDRLQATLA